MQCSDLNSFIREVEDLFSDNQAAIMLSNIHRAKGLEANHVIALNPNRIGWIHPKSSIEEGKQELNLAYILITRSMQKLTVALNDKPLSKVMKVCLAKVGK
ncbi:MAG: 3'-5' exonuclease [Rivularia sp. (in: cyanobacteria)]